MWISKKKLEELEKRITDLEGQVQSQHKVIIKHVDDHVNETKDMRKIFEAFKISIQSQCKETKEIIDDNIRSNNEVIRMIQLGLEAQRQALGIDNVKEK